jgi:hypothetical protein
VAFGSSGDGDRDGPNVVSRLRHEPRHDAGIEVEGPNDAYLCALGVRLDERLELKHRDALGLDIVQDRKHGPVRLVIPERSHVAECP